MKTEKQQIKLSKSRLKQLRGLYLTRKEHADWLEAQVAYFNDGSESGAVMANMFAEMLELNNRHQGELKKILDENE